MGVSRTYRRWWVVNGVHESKMAEELTVTGTEQAFDRMLERVTKVDGGRGLWVGACKELSPDWRKGPHQHVY